MRKSGLKSSTGLGSRSTLRSGVLDTKAEFFRPSLSGVKDFALTLFRLLIYKRFQSRILNKVRIFFY